LSAPTLISDLQQLPEKVTLFDFSRNNETAGAKARPTFSAVYSPAEAVPFYKT
jgi:hypothetical protein